MDAEAMSGGPPEDFRPQVSRFWPGVDDALQMDRFPAAPARSSANAFGSSSAPVYVNSDMAT